MIGFSKYKGIEQIEIALNLCVDKAFIRPELNAFNIHFKNYLSTLSKWRKDLTGNSPATGIVRQILPSTSEKARRKTQGSTDAGSTAYHQSLEDF